jgi:hypothetical protein
MAETEEEEVENDETGCAAKGTGTRTKGVRVDHWG